MKGRKIIIMSQYFSLLKEKFPTKSSLLTEMINLDAICHLPKGTEYFLSDLHGEYQAFDYLLRNASGSIKKKLQECFPEKILKTLTNCVSIFIILLKKLLPNKKL